MNPLSQMTHAPVILWGLVGQLLLPCEGIALRAEPAGDCLDAVPGDSCHKFVTWALATGIKKHPDWFPSFEPSDSDEQNFKQVQEIFHAHGKASCGKPCFTATSPPSAEVLQPPAAEVQKTPDAEAQATPAEAPAAAVDEVPPEVAPATSEVPTLGAQEAAPTAPAAEEAKLEAAPAELSEEAKPADAPAPAAQDQRPRSNLIGNLEAEIKALEAMRDSPSLEALRTEKRKLIQNLQAADKLEAEFKARDIQNLQTINKLEAELKALEAMDTTPALEILRAEKRATIQKLQTAVTADSEQTTREVQRLQNPAAAAREAAPAAPAEEVEPAPAQERPQGAEERPPRSDLIGKLEAELSAMDQIHDSPALETLRAEKRRLIDNLQTANKLEAELKARHLQSLQNANKLEADLRALEAMDDTDTPALETLRQEKRALLHNLQTADKADTEQTTQELQRLQDPAEAAKEVAPAPSAAIFEPEAAAADHKPWWQRRWREGKAKAKEEVQDTTDYEAQVTPAEAPAVAAEEATPEAVPAAPAEEAKPAEAPAPASTERVVSGPGGCLDAVPGDRCHEFVTWALSKGLEQHPDWFPSFKRSDSDEQSFKQMQEILYSKNKAGCGKPCSADFATAPTSEA